MGVKPEGQEQPSEHLNIKVTDNNNEVFFKIKRSTQLKKLMDAFCERQGKTIASVRFLFDGQRVNVTDTPDTLEMNDGDTLEVHQEQIGGSCQSYRHPLNKSAIEGDGSRAQLLRDSFLISTTTNNTRDFFLTRGKGTSARTTDSGKAVCDFRY